MPDEIDKPKHYNDHPSGIQCIDIAEQLGFNLGNAFKYLFRRDSKHESPTTDLKKALWYLNREMVRYDSLDEHLPIRPAHWDNPLFFDGMWPDLREDIESVVVHEANSNMAGAMAFIVRGSEDCSTADMRMATNLIQLEIDKHDS